MALRKEAEASRRAMETLQKEMNSEIEEADVKPMIVQQPQQRTQPQQQAQSAPQQLVQPGLVMKSKLVSVSQTSKVVAPAPAPTPTVAAVPAAVPKKTETATTNTSVTIDEGDTITYQISDSGNGPVMTRYMEALKDAGLPTDVPILNDSGDGSYANEAEKDTTVAVTSSAQILQSQGGDQQMQTYADNNNEGLVSGDLEPPMEQMMARAAEEVGRQMANLYLTGAGDQSLIKTLKKLFEAMESRVQAPICSAAIEPNARLKMLTQYGNSVDIDERVPPRRYYRSGLEMVRMANSYYEEGSLENAFTLYMKFVVLFVEKIRCHPEFSSVSITDRAVNAQKLREVLPRAEQLKSQLLVKFTEEYEQHVHMEKEEEAAEYRSEDKKSTTDEAAPSAPSWTQENKELWDEPTTAETPVAFDVSYSDPDVTQPIPNRNLTPSKLELPSQPSVAGFGTPSVDRSTKPQSLLSPSMHSKLGLRRVIVPSRLMQKFMSLAQQNTEQNIETCGIITGRLHHDRLVVTHLLVPKQHGTPDSCTTECEEEIFEYQDIHNLITIGWIHTHPSQTAFLSSVDLHTHCGYQQMIPEAIAIVCAPRYKETGIYMLTPNHGLNFIASCQQQGFHPHPLDPPLFAEARHAVLDEHAPIEVVDMRA